MLDLQDAVRTVVRYLESQILGVGIIAQGETESDLGKKILSAAYITEHNKDTGEDTGRVMPAPVDPKWIRAHVPSLAFWTIGWDPKADYHIKKKYIDKDFAKQEVTVREEFYRAKSLLQVESYWRTNLERELMHAQLTSLINTAGRGTGRIGTIKGDVIYLKIIQSRNPQENEMNEQGIYRLVHTWEMRVRELVPTTTPMVSNIKHVVRYGDQPVK